MDELLEAVSEAVSAMVLYAVEADEKNTRVPDILPGAQVVKATTDYLVDSASQSAEFWVKFNQPDMKQKMLDTGAQIRNATSEIVEAATTLHDDPYSKPGKKLLLKGAKGVMEHMVVLLQQADLYEVTRIVRGCARVTNKKGVLIGLEAGESYFMTAAQELVTQTVELAKMVAKRIKEIDDFVLKRRFEEASTKLRADTDAFVKAMGQVMRSDPTARETSNIISRAVDESIQEIIVVAKLSAKSPFDLSMIEGIDLRDDEDLKDMALMMKNNLASLQRAIDAGDAKDAHRLLKAVRKGLNDMVALNRALAKASEDPVLRARYEAAAREAQRMLDDVVPSLADAVEELMKKPQSQAAIRAVRGFMDQLTAAADLMTQTASRPTATDIEELLHKLEDPLAKLLEAAQRGDVALTGKMIDVIKGNVGQQLAVADTIVRNIADPMLRAHLQTVVDGSKKNISGYLAKLGEAARLAASNPRDTQLMDLLKNAAALLAGACGDLVKGCSIGTAEDIFMNHQSLAAEHQRLMAAIQAGDRKEAVSAMRSIRKLLNDQLNAAKAIARTTDDPELKAQLDAVCANAQRSIDSLMGRLASLVDTAISDPTNTEALNSIAEVFNEAQAISSRIVAACGKDLLRESNRMLLERINEMEDGIAAPDARAAVTALKAVLGEAGRQADVARMVASNFEESDPDRATRVLGLADSLASATPFLVSASKAALAAPGDSDAYAEMHRSAGKLKDISTSLVSAATMAPEDELLENAALINSEMAGLMKGLENGEALQAEQVANIVKKISAQAKLAVVVANRSKDPKSRDALLKASQTLSKLVTLMVAACKDAMANPSDPAVRGRLMAVLSDVLAANKETFLAISPVEDEDLQSASDDLQAKIAVLERALSQGTAAEVEVASRNVEKSAAKQAFLARAVLDRIDDADRKKQIIAAIDELDRLAFEVGPVVKTAKANPRDGAAQLKATTLLDELRAASHNVVSSSASSPEERMAARALVIGAQMEELEDAVKKGNASLANSLLQNVTTGITQQVRTARAAAAAASPANRAFLLEAADSLEQLSNNIGVDVKGGLAGDKAAQHKLTADAESTRSAMAAVVANVSSSNRHPADQALSVAIAMKNEIDKLATATKGNNSKVASEAITRARKGAFQQQAELVRAYAAKVDDPVHRRGVADALDELDRFMREAFYPSLAAAQTNPNDRTTVSRVTAPAESTSSLLNSVISAVGLSPEDRVSATALSAAQELGKVEGAVKKKSNPEAVTALASLKPALLDVAKATRAAAAAIRDPAQKQKLFETADELEGIHNVVSDASHNALARPSDVEAQKALTSACEQARATLGVAVALSTSSPAKQVAKTMVKIAAEIDILTACTESGAGPQAQGALANIKDPLRHQLLFARALAETVENPDTKKVMLSGIDKMRKAGPPLAAAGDAAVKTPQDAAARNKLKAAATDAKEALAEALSGAVHPEERILANTPLLEVSLDKLLATSKAGNPTKIKAHLASAANLMSEQALLSRAVAAQAPPQARAAILRDTEALEKLIPDIVKHATDLSTKPADKSIQEKIAAAVAAAKAANKAIAAHAQTHKTDKEKKKQERLRKEREERDREEKERQERVKKEQDEVAAAAAKLRERTENLKVDNSVEGKLYGTAKDIADQMEKLSKAAAAGDKRGMIEAARALAVFAQKYVEQAKAAAAKCTDPVLKEQILTSAQAAKNWSIQLKIIAAVKAASDEDSGSAKQQLVKCAKGLSKAVVLTVNAVEVSSIRAK